MKQILIKEICNEKPNSQSLGAFNESVNETVSNNFQHYLINREKRGIELVSNLKKSVEKGYENKIQDKASKILLKKVDDDYKSFSERMENYKKDKKEKSKVKKSLKGINKGLQKAILSAI
jgi:hypothetical protein